jgi:hypothetical protein
MQRRGFNFFSFFFNFVTENGKSENKRDKKVAKLADATDLVKYDVPDEEEGGGEERGHLLQSPYNHHHPQEFSSLRLCIPLCF